MDDYESVITDDLMVFDVSSANKREFIRHYLYAEDMSKYKFLGTHDGTFHSDEVMASVLLLRNPEFKKSIIVRTRDRDLLSKTDVVYDVGLEYNISTRRFDHH